MIYTASKTAAYKLRYIHGPVSGDDFNLHNKVYNELIEVDYVQSRAKVFTLLLLGRLCLVYYHTTNTSLIKLLVILKYSVESVQTNDITLINKSGVTTWCIYDKHLGPKSKRVNTFAS